MSFIQSLILGVVQGLAEFLPISSSGHLSVIQNWMNIDPDNVLTFSVMLHFGTLIAIFVVYRKDIWELLQEFCRTVKDVCTGQGVQMNKNETRHLGVMIIIASIPTGLMGLLLNDFFEGLYKNNVYIGIGLLITGTCLYLAEKHGGGRRNNMDMNVRNALFIGICQGIAIWPGISRSGATMVGGLACKFNREHAVKYAFLISIPSVLGAFLLELPDAIHASSNSPGGLGVLIAGVIVSGICGYAAIRIMIKAVVNKKLKFFSYYTWLAGAALVVYTLIAG